MIQSTGKEESTNLAQERKKITPGNQYEQDQFSYVPNSDSDDVQQESFNDESIQTDQNTKQQQQQSELWFSNKSEEEKYQEGVGGKILNKLQQLDKQINQPLSNQQKSKVENCQKEKVEEILDKKQVIENQMVKQQHQQVQEIEKVSEVEKNSKQQLQQNQHQNNLSRSSKNQNFTKKQSLKFKNIEVQTKIIYAIHYLFFDVVKNFITPQQGFIKCHPKMSNRFIRIFYKNQNTLPQVQNKIEEFIDEIQIQKVDSKVGDSGLQYSSKYRQQLKKKQMVIFSDSSKMTNNLIYYIAGKCQATKLLQQTMKIKNKKVTFLWFQLHQYKNTRSYKKILENCFQFEELKKLISERFQAKQIEVAKETTALPISITKKQKGIKCLLTFYGSKKNIIHQQIEECVKKFIDENFCIFCFTFFRENREQRSRNWLPKLDNVKFFFIDETKLERPISYLFIIVLKKCFQSIRQNIIEEVESLKKVKIVGRRFFENIQPQQSARHKEMKYLKFPQVNPYSKNVWMKNGEKFDWKKQLIL